jgi:hypothetical protein
VFISAILTTCTLGWPIRHSASPDERIGRPRFRFHETALYNSIYWSDGQLLVDDRQPGEVAERGMMAQARNSVSARPKMGSDFRTEAWRGRGGGRCGHSRGGLTIRGGA